MSAPRWERLQYDLAAAGIQAKIDERPYSEAVCGRVKHGVSRSIAFTANDMRFEIRDTWWSKNPDYWTGWAVDLVDRDGILLATTRTKNRLEAVSFVRQSEPVQ